MIESRRENLEKQPSNKLLYDKQNIAIDLDG
jgi:hypothetical protein